MTDQNYQTMFLLAAREQHEKQIKQAICEQRAFTMLIEGSHGRYGVRYGIPHLPNTGGFWLNSGRNSNV